MWDVLVSSFPVAAPTSMHTKKQRLRNQHCLKHIAPQAEAGAQADSTFLFTPWLRDPGS